MKFDYVVIGGGIVGLSTAMALTERFPAARVAVLEKENQFSAHQTGRNSGVIHSGIYYKPGSFKAQFCREGNQAMVAFCQHHGIPYDICGKVIIATDNEEIPALDRLQARAIENGLESTGFRQTSFVSVSRTFRPWARFCCPLRASPASAK